jgi:hypothetical protein
MGDPLFLKNVPFTPPPEGYRTTNTTDKAALKTTTRDKAMAEAPRSRLATIPAFKQVGCALLRCVVCETREIEGGRSKKRSRSGGIRAAHVNRVMLMKYSNNRTDAARVRYRTFCISL